MTLREAIAAQEKRLASPFLRANPDTVQATRIGIEAMKRVQDARDIDPESPAADLLPGETKERR